MVFTDNSQEAATERRTENDERLIRFRKAYFRMTKKQRMAAQQSFLTVHEIEPQTFRAKLSGMSKVMETEVEWMEKYNPYQPSQAA